MATIAASKIAARILKKAEEEALRSYRAKLGTSAQNLAAMPGRHLRAYAVGRFFNHRPVGKEIHEKLLAAGVHPAVAQDWANEPKRRVGMAKMELDRGARAERARKAEAKRKEDKRIARAKFLRSQKKMRTAARKSMVARALLFIRGAFRRQ